MLHMLKQSITESEGKSSNEVIALDDFAENYSFVVQEKIQGMHWSCILLY